MYHHRYQPQTSNLANTTNHAINNRSFNSNVNTSSTKLSYPSNNSRNDPRTSSVSSTVTSAAVKRISAPTASLDTAAHPNSVDSSTNSFNNYTSIDSNSAYLSPFSSLPKQFVEERQDVIFRRVRGILNKITPETFDKLTKELVNVGLDSPRTLRGVIYLLFDKALKDLKYSSLYAKLCQELSEKAPNFEHEPRPNTFCKFLISKCEDEFERRRKATEDFDSKTELTDDEFEQKSLAKQKMLGNIKFICELGKKRLLQEEILHECIRGLLSKKKKERPIQDQAQDLECLCQIMRTIGSLLDVEASRNLMNQYFERIEMYSKKQDLPSRIRFMLKDVIDLRNNNWRPRPFQREDNVPQPLSKLREELGFSNTSPGCTNDKLGNKNLINMNDLTRMSGGKLNHMLVDDEPSFTTTADFHWGSSFLPDNPAFEMFSNPAPPLKVENGVHSATSASTIDKSMTRQSQNYTNSTVTTGQLKPDIFNDYKYSSLNNRIDPFSDSFKPKHSSNNNTVFDSNAERRLNTNKDVQLTGFKCRNEVNSNIRGLARDPMPLSQGRTSPYERLNDGKANRGNGFEREVLARPQMRNNLPYHNNIHNSPRNISNRNDRQFNHIEKPAYEDSPRPQPSVRRIGTISSDSDKFPARGKANDMMPPPPPPPPPAMLYNSQANNKFQAHSVENAQRFESDRLPQAHIPTSEPVNSRDKRFNRRIERQDVRPQRFNAINYNNRPVGRDRNLSNQPFSRNRVPESESNPNWRSAAGPSKKPSSPVPTVINDLTMQHSKVIEIESKIDKSSGPVVAPKNETMISNVQLEKPIDKMFPHGKDTFKEPQSAINKLDLSSPLSDMNGLQQNLPFVKDDFKAPGFVDDTTAINSKTSDLRRQDNKQLKQYHPNVQTKRPMNKERKDTPRKPLGPTVEFDGRIYQRPYHNESASLERKNFKPNMTRNQSFEAPNRIDPKRIPTSRADGAVNASTQSILKDSVAPAIPSSLFPKAPIRMNEAEFSLRPSHNLAGKTSSNVPVPRLNVIAGQEPAECAANFSAGVKQGSGHHAGSKLPFEKSSSDVKPAFNESSIKKEVVKTASKKPDYGEQFMNIFCEIFKSERQEPGKIAEFMRVAAKIKELKVPKQHQVDCLVGVIKKAIVKPDSDQEMSCKLLAQIVPSSLETSSLIGAFQVIFEQLQGMEVEIPKVKSLVAGFLSQATLDGLTNIADVASISIGGKHHPFFLLYLQKLEKITGKAWMSEKFIASKVNLMDMLPEVDRSKERLATQLKDRCLGFLDPMLTIEPDLWEQMRHQDPTPAAVYRWIKENVDQTIQSTTTFAHVFVRCLLRYIHNSSMEKLKSISLSDGVNADGSSSNSSSSSKSSPTNVVSQVVSDNEKELLSKYQHILQAILKDKSMQLASLYALQNFYYNLDFPKGAILRWFHLLYDMSIVDDDVYFTWKEEINDKYPGKGQALFQVNAWLHWLAEAESEEDEDAS